MTLHAFLRVLPVLALLTGSLAVGAEKTGVLLTLETRNDAPSKAPLVVSSGGKARLPILVADAASEGTRTRAREFKTFLDRITGAEFEMGF